VRTENLINGPHNGTGNLSIYSWPSKERGARFFSPTLRSAHKKLPLSQYLQDT
jgi:hypothetical protein